MQTPVELKTVWEDLATLIDTLSPEEKVRYQNAIRTLIHDLRQNISITYGAEALLRRSIPDTEDNLELLDGIRVANQRVVELINDLAQSFDSHIDLPLQKPSVDE